MVMLLEKTKDFLQLADEDTKKLDLSKFEGWNRTHFPKGKVRCVHVNRHAIMQNVKRGKNHPTIVVRDGDETHQFHYAIMFGQTNIGFDANPENVEANVYIETEGKILCFNDPAGEDGVPLNPRDKQKPKRNWLKGLVSLPSKMWKGIKFGSWHAARNTPLLGCLVDFEYWHPDTTK